MGIVVATIVLQSHLTSPLFLTFQYMYFSLSQLSIFVHKSNRPNIRVYLQQPLRNCVELNIVIILSH